ncbi:MAG: transposase, partial [Opitutales bacterium]|nr:transposase [Opitutales bacterium]
ARMGDVSVFMREVKTRFTLWYNEKHGMVGTFGAERFRSVVVEADTAAQRMVAAYIDLNPVRARLEEDAGDYGLSGFGEACAGGSAARRGIARIEGADDFSPHSAGLLPASASSPGPGCDHISLADGARGF